MTATRTAGLPVLAPLSAMAHESGPLQPDDLWRAWEFDPGVVIPLAISAVLYLRGGRAAHGVIARRMWCFWGGYCFLALALVSPLHPLGEVLFSAHMAQHEILMLVAAPLLALSRPLTPFLWGMPLRWRRAIGRWSKTAAAQRGWRTIVEPGVAWCISAGALWAWHSPELFQATLTSDLVHTLPNVSASFFPRCCSGGRFFIRTVASGMVGSILHIHHRYPHKYSRRAADVRTPGLVPGLPSHRTNLGIDCA